MPEVFRTPVPAVQETEALVIHCSSARFQAQLQRFVSEGLRLRRYSLIAVPGGVQVLTLLDYLPKFSWAGWRWVKFLVDLEKPARVILVGHEECSWYRDLRFMPRGKSSRERIVDDLKLIARHVSERFPDIRVETYYAAIAGGHSVFETV